MDENSWRFVCQEADAAFQITPDALQDLRSWCDWVLAEFLHSEDSGRELPAAAGQRYASVYALKLKGQPHDELVLTNVEANASVRWLAKWRFEAHQEISSKAEAGSTATSASSQWRSWMNWAKGVENDGSATGPAKDAWGEGFSVEALLNEVDAKEELPELTTPTRFELHMRISQYTAVCDASGTGWIFFEITNTVRSNLGQAHHKNTANQNELQQSLNLKSSQVVFWKLLRVVPPFP